jgi:hypothetical protein
MLQIVRFFGDKQAQKALEWVLSHEPVGEAVCPMSPSITTTGETR